MITREVEAFLATLSGYLPAEIDQRIRPLREHNLIPSGPRGLNALHLEPLHVALCLLTMVARRATDAAPVAIRAMDLKIVPREGVDIGEAVKLAPIIMMGIIRGSAMISRVEVTCDGAMAWVTVADESLPLFFCDNAKLAKGMGKDIAKYKAAGSHYCGHRFVITGAVLDMIGAEMADDAPAKYSERRP